MKLKKKKSIKNKLIIIFILIIISSFIFLYYISNKVMPTIMITSKNIVKETGMNIISENVSDKIISILDREELFKIVSDNLKVAKKLPRLEQTTTDPEEINRGINNLKEKRLDFIIHAQ